MYKSAWLAGVLALFTLCVASAKTYSVSFSAPAKVGTAQLKAGDYQIKIDGSKITFIDVKTNKGVTTDGKIENVTKSFDGTRVETTTQGDTNVVKDIEVGGSKIKIEF